MIKKPDDLYRFIERLKIACGNNNETQLYKELDDALNLGSSGLEIIGALGHIIKSNRKKIEQLLNTAEHQEINEAINYVHRSYTD